jgi:hypothetical protein
MPVIPRIDVRRAQRRACARTPANARAKGATSHAPVREPPRRPGLGRRRQAASGLQCVFEAQRDSAGLKLCGSGEWLLEKHATKTRRSWRKLDVAMDADTGRIVAVTLTNCDVDDGSPVGPLLDQVDGPAASFTADGAYDRDGVSREIATRHPNACAIVLPRSNTVPEVVRLSLGRAGRSGRQPLQTCDGRRTALRHGSTSHGRGGR